MKLLFGGWDPDTSAILNQALSKSGLQFDVEPEAGRVLVRMGSGEYDLLFLASSDGDAFSLLRQIRAQSKLPVLLITPEEAWSDRVRGFRLGADDCVSKPFHTEELLARIAAILRRTPVRNSSPQPIRVGDLLIYPSSRRVYLGERELKLTPMECDILEALMSGPGRPVTRDQLALRLYHRAASPFDRSVDTHVSRIRRKLGSAGRLIISIRGSGYQLCDPGDALRHTSSRK